MKERIPIFEDLLNNRLVMHLLFWVVVFLISPFFSKHFPTLRQAYIAKALMLPAQIGATYGLIYYALPKFIYRKKYIGFFLVFALNIVLFTTLAHLFRDLGAWYFGWTWNHNSSPHSLMEILSQPFQNIWRNAEDIYLTVFVVTALKIVKQRFEEKHQLTLLEKEKANAEIKLLKAQINPRILSKTLAHLYDLAKEKSDLAPEVVIKLSDMLDYMLYQCNAPKVLVSDEIQLIQNYLDLEKMRYGDRLRLQFDQQLTTQEMEVAPLLLLSLVELAFSPQTALSPNKVHVTIIIKEEKEQLHVQLNSNLLSEKDLLNSNIRKQLDLLYPNQYQLETIAEKDACYLALRLSSFGLPT